MRHPTRTNQEGPLSRRQRSRAIRDAIRRRRTLKPLPPLPVNLSTITAGSTVSFHDARGRFVTGTVLDDESFRVVKSNFVSPWTVLCKSPYMSWEESLRVVGGSTLIKPRDLLGFTRMLVDDVDLEEADDEDEDQAADDQDGYRRRA